MSSKGLVFNIQRFSIHDGPGIRTTVFLKGCTLSCFWCHNPEGRKSYLEIQYFPDRCIACGECVTACPHSAHELHDKLHVFLRERCEASGKCVETCYAQALQLNGRLMSVERVMEEVVRDSPFYDTSGGGVTLSGGEPVLSGEFGLELLQQCKRQGLHTAIETCGECPWTTLESFLPYTDLVMMDIKLMAADKHKAATGKANDRILDNARRLALTEKQIIFRTPVVPSVNDSEEEIQRIAAFVQELISSRNSNGHATNGSSTIRYELLSFHRLASGKYSSLGLEYKAAAFQTPKKERMSELLAVARSRGVEACVR